MKHCDGLGVGVMSCAAASGGSIVVSTPMIVAAAGRKREEEEEWNFIVWGGEGYFPADVANETLQK